MNRFTRRLLGGSLATAMLAFCATQQPALPQASAVQNVTSLVVSTTAASGTSDVLALDGKYTNCTIYVADSNNSGSVTVVGNTNAGQYGPVSPNITNTSFGTNGVIPSLTSTVTAYQGNSNIAPVGIYYTWTGNTGTFNAWMTCSQNGGITAQALPAAQSSVAIASPLCNSNTAVCTYDLHSPLPLCSGNTAVCTYDLHNPFAVASIPANATAQPALCHAYGVTNALNSTTQACVNPVQCNQVANVTTNVGTSTIATVAAGQSVYICGWSVMAWASPTAGGTPPLLSITYSTGTSTCAGQTVAIQGPAVPTSLPLNSQGVQWNSQLSPGGFIFSSPGATMCIRVNPTPAAAINPTISGYVFYTVF